MSDWSDNLVSTVSAVVLFLLLLLLCLCCFRCCCCCFCCSTAAFWLLCCSSSRSKSNTSSKSNKSNRVTRKGSSKCSSKDNTKEAKAAAKALATFEKQQQEKWVCRITAVEEWRSGKLEKPAWTSTLRKDAYVTSEGAFFCQFCDGGVEAMLVSHSRRSHTSLEKKERRTTQKT